MASDPANRESPVCPRCGYDQTGVVGSWKDACPLEGICSECGLAFAWRDLLNPRLNLPRWSFEHGRRVSPVRWVRTCGRALKPVSFWRLLRLEHPVIVRRLVFAALVLLMLGHAGVVGATVWRAYRAAAQAMTGPRFIMSPGATRPVRTAPALPTPGVVMRDFGPGLALVALWPYTPRMITANPGPPAPGPRVGGGKARLVLAWPPASAYVETVSGVWLVWLCAFVLAVPPGFLVLGETFRRCRVRFVHLVRGVAYSLVGPVAAVLAAAAGGAAGLRFGPLLASVGVAWLCVYWWVFASRYLRLIHAPWVALAMLVIGGLVSSLAGIAGWMLGMRGYL